MMSTTRRLVTTLVLSVVFAGCGAELVLSLS